MKVYLIIGGSKGNGKEFIKRLLKNSNNLVLLISRNEIKINLKNIIHFPTDLLNKKELKNTIKEIKKRFKLDGIVFFQKYRPSDPLQANLIDNFTVSIESTKIIIESMKNNFKKKGLRSIVLIGSIASKFVAQEQPSDYHIVKSSLIGLLNYYAVKLASNNIKVNMVSPAMVIKEENEKFYKSHNELLNIYKDISPLGNITNAKDIANLVYYLISKKSKFIIGQDIWIDSGTSLVWQDNIGKKFSKLNTLKITQ